MSVTKKDLSIGISKKLGLSQKDSLFFVSTFFSVIVNSSNKGVNISNFGSFTFKKTPSRVGRNPKTLKEYKIRARQKLSFKPSEVIKTSIN